MAKKRKLRSSESQAPITPEPEGEQAQQQPPSQPEATSEETQLQGQEQVPEDPNLSKPIDDEVEHQGPQHMAVDGTNEGQEHEQEEEGEEREGEELSVDKQEQNQNVIVSSEGPQPEENGGGSEEEYNDEEDAGDEPLEKLLEPFSKEQLLILVKKATENYPNFIENVREMADKDPAHRKIFVHGLGWDTTAETLISEFGKYGEIEDCKCVTDKVSGKAKGYAFILFKHRSGASKALIQPQKKIGNRTTSCQLASAGPVPAPPPVVPPVSEYTQRKIFVSNVSAEVDPQRLLEFFKQFGEIEDGPLGLDKHTGKPKGFALFVYKSIESARKALEEPHKTFEGLTLHCQKAVDGPKPTKGYSHHQHHPQNQPPYHSRKDKNKYTSGRAAKAPGHLMAPAGPGAFNPAQGLNPALGQALSALIASQGAGLGIGNMMGAFGAPPANQGVPPAGYSNQPVGSYGNQPMMQGAYQNPQMGQSSGVRPHPGPGAPYMGH